MSYLHGIELKEVYDSPPSVSTVSTSDIALIAACEVFETRGSFVVSSLKEFLTLKDDKGLESPGLGLTEMAKALKAIFLQTSARIVCIPTPKDGDINVLGEAVNQCE